jgi:hypothetical protein
MRSGCVKSRFRARAIGPSDSRRFGAGSQPGSRWSSPRQNDLGAGEDRRKMGGGRRADSAEKITAPAGYLVGGAGLTCTHSGPQSFKGSA